MLKGVKGRFTLGEGGQSTCPKESVDVIENVAFGAMDAAQDLQDVRGGVVSKLLIVGLGLVKGGVKKVGREIFGGFRAVGK